MAQQQQNDNKFWMSVCCWAVYLYREQFQFFGVGFSIQIIIIKIYIILCHSLAEFMIVYKIIL